jgi:pimeloyl-ACP methyl ester carboxylesterase
VINTTGLRIHLSCVDARVAPTANQHHASKVNLPRSPEKLLRLADVRQDIQLQTGRLEAAWWGSDSTARPPMVLLHEGLGSVSRWRDLPDELAARTGRRVLAYSRFGYGRSDVPARPRSIWFLHDEAALLPEVLDAAGIQRAVLFGHSDGASIALMATATTPSRVEALVLEAPHVFVEDVSVASVNRAVERYRTGDLRERLAKHHAHVDVAFGGWSEVWLDPAFLAWNLQGFLPRISCPVLLIQGADDEYGTLRQIDAIEESVRGRVERLVLPECGHAPHRDQRDAVLAAVTNFLQQPP